MCGYSVFSLSFSSPKLFCKSIPIFCETFSILFFFFTALLLNSQTINECRYLGVLTWVDCMIYASNYGGLYYPVILLCRSRSFYLSPSILTFIFLLSITILLYFTAVLFSISVSFSFSAKLELHSL
jgi:hypothetical protein